MLNKLHNILTGWKNYVWESEEIKALANSRAIICAKCEHAERAAVLNFMEDEVKEIQGMVCNFCDCPLSAKLRSPNETCPKKSW